MNDDPFLIFTLIVVGVMILGRVVTVLLGDQKHTPKKPCGPHKWKPNDKNVFECSTCGFIAGSHKSEKGSY